MRKQLKIKWTCNARVDCVDLPLLKAMKKSGCRKISYGIESGDQTVLNNINKNITSSFLKEIYAPYNPIIVAMNP